MTLLPIRTVHIAWSGDARESVTYLTNRDFALVDRAILDFTQGVRTRHEVRLVRDDGYTRVYELRPTPGLIITLCIQGRLLRVRNIQGTTVAAAEPVWVETHRARRRDTRSTGDTARWTTSLAGRIAGERRSHLIDEWFAVLAGAPEGGINLTTWQQRRLAIGFLIAALRFRLHDAGRPLWRPVDWLLATESRTRTLITLAVGGQVIYIQKHDGLYGVLTEGWGWCGGCAVALHFFFRWLRKVRGIELALPGENSDDT